MRGHMHKAKGRKDDRKRKQQVFEMQADLSPNIRDDEMCSVG